jgi:hypothetical protein
MSITLIIVLVIVYGSLWALLAMNSKLDQGDEKKSQFVRSDKL